MEGISDFLEATFATAPSSGESKSLGSENVLVDIFGATLTGDASNVINIPRFEEMLRGTSRRAGGMAFGAPSDCLLRQDPTGER